MLIHEDRLFPADPATRAVARRLYDAGARSADRLAARPYRSALVRARTSRFPIRRASSSCRTITSSACSTARACRLKTSASGRRDGGAGRDGRPRDLAASSPSIITSSAARRPEAGSTTPSRRCSVSRSAFREANADLYYDTIAEALAKPEYRPRALFERFNIEVIATTESPLDELKWHRAIRDSGWSGRVVTAYRPDPVVDPDFEGFPREPRRASARLTGEDTSTWAGYLAAHRKRRAYLQDARRDLDRPRPSDRPHRGPVASRGRGPVPARHARAMPRPRMPSCSAPRC